MIRTRTRTRSNHRGGRGPEQIQPASRKRRARKWGCRNTCKFLNHGSEVCCVCRENRSGCTPRRSRPLLWVAVPNAADSVVVSMVVRSRRGRDLIKTRRPTATSADLSSYLTIGQKGLADFVLAAKIGNIRVGSQRFGPHHVEIEERIRVGEPRIEDVG